MRRRSKRLHALPADVHFEISDSGDPSVGIPAGVSHVTTFVTDEAHLEEVREALAEWFAILHDFPVSVLTAQELRQESEREDDW